MAELKDLPKALERVKRQLLTAFAQFQSNTAGKITVGLAKATPVRTGYAQSNWFMGLTEVFQSRDFNLYDSGEVSEGPGYRATRTAALRQAKALPQRIMRADGKGTKPIFVGNVTPYLRYLDEGRSVQAPSNFIERTARSEFRNAIQAAQKLSLIHI